MPLENSCEEYKGRLLYVWPIIGFGWCRIDPSARSDQPGEAIEPPAPFHARLLEFHYFAGQIAGGTGIVEEPNHPLHKNWVAFCIRDRGTDMYNLTTNPGKYNVNVGKSKPAIKIDLDIPMPQWMRFGGPPVASGFGFVAESETWIKEKHHWMTSATPPGSVGLPRTDGNQ